MKTRNLLFLLLLCTNTKIYSQDKLNKSQLKIGEEVVSLEEENKLNAILSQILKGAVKKGTDSRTGQDHPAKRDAHAKQHGCVAAKFKIEENLPNDFKKGLFANQKEYKAIIRFSNGSGELRSDKATDAHGMAIKVLNAPAGLLTEQESNGEVNTQDFVMIDHPVFFMRKSADYLPFFTAQRNGPEGFKEWLKNNPYEGKIVIDTLSKAPINPLASQYWSQTPYKLGDKNAMKFSAQPCEGQVFTEIQKDLKTDTYLKETLTKHLSENNSCFNLFITLQKDAQKNPIEDPTVEWPTIWNSKNNYFKVATVYIPKGQTPASQEALNICEELSFTPWHASEDLRPLGGINRTRKTVYLELSKFRNELNSVKQLIPTEETWKTLAPK